MHSEVGYTPYPSSLRYAPYKSPAHQYALHPLQASHLRNSFDEYSQSTPRSSVQSEYDDDENDPALAHLSKEELRKHKNRQSAARSRQRMRSRLEQLEKLVVELNSRNQSLEHELQSLMMEQMMSNPLPTSYRPY